MSDLHHLPHGRRLAFLSPANQDQVAAYLTLLQSRQYAPRSLEGIISALHSFGTLLPPEPRQRLCRDFAHTTSDDIDAWLEAATPRLAPSTRQNRLRLLHGFFDFLIDQGQLIQQPVRRHRHHVHVPQRLPRPMADAEVVAFFGVIDSLHDRVLFLLMLRCGLRVSEAHRLAWSAIDWEQGTIRIEQAKGHVDRIVYLCLDLEKALAQWHRVQPVGTAYLFPSPQSRKAGAPLHTLSVHRRMARYVAQAGLPSHYTTHSLRHTFATSLLNAGADLEVVKELMGHTTLDMTLRYAKVYDSTKRQQYDQAMAQTEHRYPLKRS